MPKLAVVKLVKELTGLGLKEAKGVVDSAPTPIKENIKPEEAQEIIETKKGKISKEIALNNKSYEVRREMVNAIVILNEIMKIKNRKKGQGSKDERFVCRVQVMG